LTAAFDYEFGAIEEGADNKLAKAYNNLLFVFRHILCPGGFPSYHTFLVQMLS
jgi:hypothetical protein